MKKISYWLLAALLFAATACTDNEDDDALKPGANDIATGVSYNDQQIILADRNFGATELDGIGSFLNRAEAKTACPKGYHMMTISEAKALIADDRYSTPEKFLAAFHIPYSSYIVPASTVNNKFTRASSLENMAFLHIQNSTMIIDNGNPENPPFVFIPAPAAFQLNLRCVKGEVSLQKSTVSGSFQITGGITMTPKYAGLGIIYTNTEKTTIGQVWVVLSSDEPTDEYDSEPKEYVSLYFVPDATNPQQCSLRGGYYSLTDNNIQVDLINENSISNSTLEYDPSKKSFSLTVDTKDGTTQIAKGTATGTYIALSDNVNID